MHLTFYLFEKEYVFFIILFSLLAFLYPTDFDFLYQFYRRKLMFFRCHLDFFEI